LEIQAVSYGNWRLAGYSGSLSFLRNHKLGNQVSGQSTGLETAWKADTCLQRGLLVCLSGRVIFKLEFRYIPLVSTETLSSR